MEKIAYIICHSPNFTFFSERMALKTYPTVNLFVNEYFKLHNFCSLVSERRAYKIRNSYRAHYTRRQVCVYESQLVIVLYHDTSTPQKLRFLLVRTGQHKIG